MAYHTLFVCDACRRPPNGDSPDCVYSHESYPSHCDCDKHDLCDECMRKQRQRVREDKSTFKCRACEIQHRCRLTQDPVTATELISKMLPYVDFAYECAFPDDKSNRELYNQAKEWLEEHE